MRLFCAICGRRTTPFLVLGGQPIGPKCAKKAGLTPAKATNGSRVKKPTRRPGGGENLELFEGME